MGNIVKAVFGSGIKKIVTAPLYQYDYGQILMIEGIELPALYEVHFCNDPYGSSTTSMGTEDGVAIPDTYLQDADAVHAWLYLHTGEDDGETVAQVTIPLIRRSAVTHETPTPQQQSEIEELVAALEHAVEEAEDAQSAAEDAEAGAIAAAGHYPTIGEDGYWYLYNATTKQYVKSSQKAQGEKGDPGNDGTSPTATVTKSGSTATITITDKNGTTTETVSDGEQGEPGEDGTDATPDLITVNYDDLTFPVVEGTFCYHSGKLYEANQDISTSEDWTAAHWTETTVEEQLNTVKSELTSVENTLDNVLVPENIFDDRTFVLNEQISTSYGTFVAGNGYMRSGYIPISSSGVVNVGMHGGDVKNNTIMAHYAFYTSAKAKISTGFGMYITVKAADDFHYQQIEVPNNAAYFAFDASMSHYSGKDFYVSQIQTPTTYVAYGVGKINPSLLRTDKTLTQTGLPANAKAVGDKFSKEDKAITSMRGGNLATVKAASLASGEGLYLFRNSVIKNKTYIFNAKVTGDSWSVIVAHGVVDDSFASNDNSQGYVVTPTTATIWVNGNDGENGTLGTSWTHGLTINDRLTVIISIDDEQKQTITLISESGLASKSYTAQFNGRKGTIYAKSLAGTFTDAMLSFACSDLEKPVWLFGDSYVSVVDSRYPYWLKQAKADNCLINSYPGEATPNAIIDCKALLNIGTPKFIVWGLGMNDHDTSSAVNSDWMDGVNELIEICEASGITLILATIPNVVNTSCNNVKKNAWIAASGYRYVDFNKAIGAADEPGAAWPAGWLSNDNVHPTEMGARVLAGQIMLDVPELMMP